MIRFGPSGNDELFYLQGFTSSVQAPAWLSKRGLSALEVNFGRGIRMSEDTAREIGEQAAKHGIRISAHAPYFINLAREFDKSFVYIEKSLKLLKIMGGRDLVVHIGSQGKLPRRKAVENCKENLKKVFEKLEIDFDYRICPETMGRFHAIGDYKEICEICTVHARAIPTLDFGHINCLLKGGLRVEGAIAAIMDYCTGIIGAEKMKNVHIHFSPIKFGNKGELGHLDFETAPEIFTPPFEPLAQYIIEKGLDPTVICESHGRMAQDAEILKKIFYKVLK